MTTCIMCGANIEGSGWEHSNWECQDAFVDTGREAIYFEVEDPDEETIAACSEGCWKAFMEESFGE